MVREKAPHGAGNLRERNGRWIGALSLDGTRYYFSGATWAEADRERRRLIDRHRAGLAAQARPETVAALLTRWLASAPASTPKGMDSYRYLVDAHLVPGIGRVQVAKLTVTQVEAVMAAMIRDGLSPRTATMARNALRAALNWAMRDGDLVRNVAALAAPPANMSRRAQPLTPAQAETLLTHVATHRLYALYLCALALGLREGELLGLRWADVDLAAATLTLGAQGQYVPRDGETPGGMQTRPLKTRGSAATLPLPAVVVATLRAHKARQAEERLRARCWTDCDLVFPSRVGTLLSSRNLYRHWKSVREEIGLPTAHFHDLRSTAPSWLAARGVPLAVVQAILRHSTSQTTERFYIHLGVEEMRAAMREIDAVLAPKRDA